MPLAPNCPECPVPGSPDRPAYGGLGSTPAASWRPNERPLSALRRRCRAYRRMTGLTQRGRSCAGSKLPPLRHPVKRGVALERTHVGRKEAEADRAAAVAVVDAVDQRRQFLAFVIVGRKQVRLMPGGGDQVEQHNADAERLIARDAAPELIEPREPLCCRDRLGCRREPDGAG